MREVGEGGLREICQTMSVISAEIVINSRLEFPDVTPFMEMPKFFYFQGGCGDDEDDDDNSSLLRP